MSFFKWLVAGTVAASVGGIAWVLIGYYSNYEIGWIAWGIGLLAGIGVRWAAGDRNSGAAPGLAAVTAAAAVVALSKYLVVSLILHDSIAAQLAHDRPDFQSEQFALVRTADGIIEAEYFAAGKDVEWPEGVTWEDADEEADYPAAVWTEARSRWSARSADDQRAQRQQWQREYEAGLDAFISQMRSDAFAQSFSVYDLLWFGLAMFTAFRVGSGLQSGEPAQAEPQPAGDDPHADPQAVAGDLQPVDEDWNVEPGSGTESEKGSESRPA